MDNAGRFVIADGMVAHSILRGDREGKFNIDRQVGRSPSIRNALASAGVYAGLQIPSEEVPATKDTLRTLVLGEPEQTALLLAALRKQHGA